MRSRLIAAAVGAVLGMIGGAFIGARMHLESGAGVSVIVMIGIGGGLAGAFAGFLIGDKLLR